MLIRVATIGYARVPDFEVQAPNAPTREEKMAWALVHRPVFRAACEKEGVDLKVAKRIVEQVKKKRKRGGEGAMQSKL